MSSPTDSVPAFRRKLLVYVPVFNCANIVVSVLSRIPPAVWSVADLLVIDNHSDDGSSDRILAAIEDHQFPGPIRLVRTEKNLGYAGSQKLAYKMALASPSVKYIAMLHGDGQYDPELLNHFLPHADGPDAVVYGYRDRKAYPDREETPLTTYAIIKTLSVIESAITGVHRKEWHTGFVMYATEFLARLDLDAMTSTPHIDGQMLFLSGALREKVRDIPIYKRYRELDAFSGLARIVYVLNVFRLLLQFRLKRVLPLRGSQSARPLSSFTILY